MNAILSFFSGSTSLTPQRDLHQSCRHPVRSWGNQSFGSHLHNMTVSNGRLRIPQTGRYYLYAQVYFRYLTLYTSSEHQSISESQQVVQCVYKKTAYAQPIQLLKGVGTKCWAPDSENALHSIYQGGMFELRAGDEIFVSVSSPTAVHAEDSSSYFGAFRFDLWALGGWNKEGSAKLPVYLEISMKQDQMTQQQTNGMHMQLIKTRRMLHRGMERKD